MRTSRFEPDAQSHQRTGLIDRATPRTGHPDIGLEGNTTASPPKPARPNVRTALRRQCLALALEVKGGASRNGESLEEVERELVRTTLEKSAAELRPPHIPGHPSAFLILRASLERIALCDISWGSAVSIGRDEANSIRFPWDPTVSRFHAIVEYAGSGPFLWDLDSVNGVSVTSPTGEVERSAPTGLDCGDRLRVGHETLAFVLPAQVLGSE